MPSWTPLIVFLACYALFVAWPRRRALVACFGAGALMALGELTPHEALLEHVHWNVIGLFFGTLILAELFMLSRMPAVLAEAFVRRSRSARGAMLWLCALASFLSVFLENVAVVLLVAPVALSLAERLRTSPVRLLILIAVCSNLQGTATLIGDPPSMILAGHLSLSFNQFFFYQGRPGIFFAVQAGAVASMLVSAWLLRGHGGQPPDQAVERPRSWVPTGLLAALVAGLATTSVFDPEFRWLAGTYTLALAAAGLVWFRLRRRDWGTVRGLVRTLDWDTTFFLVGVFIVVGGLSESGWLERVAGVLAGIVGHSLPGAFILIVAVSVLISGFVDNVPFLLAMIPVADQVARSLNAPHPELLLFGLLIGACVGGNITPIGASANIVAMGLLRKQGHAVGFGTFMRVGIPFTVAAVLASCAWLWMIWT
jgi:Na+/H+ antiporter NhaD/arsenite permease-like protein